MKNNTIFRQISCILFTGCDCRCVHRVCAVRTKCRGNYEETRGTLCQLNVITIRCYKKKIIGNNRNSDNMEQLILILISKILFHIRETIHIERMHKIVSEFSALDPWLVMGFGFNGSICAHKKARRS